MGQEQGESRFQAHSSISARSFDDVVFLVDPERGAIHELNAVGTRIWQLSDGKHTLDAIAVTLAEEFEVSLEKAHHDTKCFTEDLVTRELLLRIKDPPL